jgi:hypothetical protein
VDLDAGPEQHQDQRVDAEAAYLAAVEIADARLRDPKSRSRVSLGPARAIDGLAERDHQVRAKLHVAGLRILATEIAPDVPGGGNDQERLRISAIAIG